MPKHSPEFYQNLFAKARAANEKKGIVITEQAEATGWCEFTLDAALARFCGSVSQKEGDADK